MYIFKGIEKSVREKCHLLKDKIAELKLKIEALEDESDVSGMYVFIVLCAITHYILVYLRLSNRRSYSVINLCYCSWHIIFLYLIFQWLSFSTLSMHYSHVLLTVDYVCISSMQQKNMH